MAVPAGCGGAKDVESPTVSGAGVWETLPCTSSEYSLNTPVAV